MGHSAFRLRGKEVTIVTDPYSPENGINMGKPSAAIVTVSHEAPDHSYIDGVSGEPRLVKGPGEYEVADVLIAGVATQSEPFKGPINTAYVFRFDDLAVCHLGDVHDKLSNDQVEAIGAIDVLLIPVGGGDGLTPSVASEVVSQLEPMVVVPMQYAIEGMKSDGLRPVDDFLRDMGFKDYAPEPRLSVTRSTLPSETRIVVLENKRVER